MSLELEQPAVIGAPPAPTRATPARLGYVDGLRALAALYVVVFHSYPPAHAPNALLSVVFGALSYGRFAVSAFIVLSGFSLMLPVVRNGGRLPWSAWGFYWRRARRILPPYYFAMALSLLFIWLLLNKPTGTIWDTDIPVTWANVVEHLALVQDFINTGHGAINHAFWSIAMECQIYVFFPAFVMLWRRYPPLLALALILLFALALLFALTPTWVGQTPGYAVNQFVPQYFGLFGMGIFAASLSTSPSALWKRLGRWGFWEVAAAVSFAVFVWKITTWPAFALDGLIGVVTIGLLLASARPGGRNPIRAVLEWRLLVWIGGFSYSLYLIHAPLIQVLWQYVFHPLGLGDVATYLLLLVVGGPLIVLAAWGFWWLCERPFLNSQAAVLRPRWRGQDEAVSAEAGPVESR